MKDSAADSPVVEEEEQTWEEFVASEDFLEADDDAVAGDDTTDAPEVLAEKEAPAAEEEPAAPEAWEIDLKVAGETSKYALDIEALKNRESEAYKDLQVRLQKAADYDRPGGALDKKADRLARERQIAELKSSGVVITNPATGQDEYAPWFLAAYNAQQSGGVAQAPATNGVSADKLDGLYRRALDGDRNAFDEYVTLKSRQETSGLESRLAQQREQAHRQQLDQQAIQTAESQINKALDEAFAEAGDAFKKSDGKLDEKLVAEIRAHATSQAWAAKDLEAGRQSVKLVASAMNSKSTAAMERAKSELLEAAKKSRKKATTVLRGGPPSSSSSDDDDLGLDDPNIQTKYLEFLRSQGIQG